MLSGEEELSQYDAPALNRRSHPPRGARRLVRLCARPPMLRGKPYGP